VTYNGNGTVATATSPSGAVTSYGYDGDGQLTTITPPSGGSLVRAALNYQCSRGLRLHT
jgi:YD repeat-containing protein